LTIRATGYDLADPGAVDVAAGKTATRTLQLQKARDIAAQMSSAELAASWPGIEAQKVPLVNHSCTYCHTLDRVVKFKHTAEQWVPVLTRMQTYFLDGTAVSGDRGRGAREHADMVEAAAQNPNFGAQSKAALGQYLATLNLSGGRTDLAYALKPFPRPKRAATRVIMTQWDIPRKDTVAHDIAVDANGHPWYNDQSRMYIGTLDPKTSKFTEYALPPLPAGRTGGVSDLEFDRNGGLWTMLTPVDGHCHFGIPAKFDPKTGKITFVEIANRDEVLGTQNPCGLHFAARAPDGRMWFSNTQALLRVDPATAKVDGTFLFNKGEGVPPGRHVGYQVVVNSKGNGYISDFGGRSHVIAVDGKTGKATFHQTPTANAGARRGQMDAQDRFWFAEYRANNAAMFDTNAGTFKEWPMPTPYTYPYTASAPDSKGRVYYSSNTAERLVQLDPASGAITEYVIPTPFDSKKILHDPTARRTTLWLSNKRTARILRVEVLD
jgi:streptogramin lyase